MGQEDVRPLISATALASFSRQLRRVDTYDALIELVRSEVSERFGLTNAWLYVCEGEADPNLVLVATSGPRTDAIREHAPVIPRAVTWGIVQQHGGMIQGYSELGLGTAFKVYLPTAEQVASQVGTKIAGAVPGGVERVLIADDQPHVLTLLKRILEGAGYRVTTASDGAEAVAIASSSTFDLYLLDAVMPRMNGREVCERIRQQQPAARFLFASGYGADALPASFLKDLGFEMIPKPLHPDALLRAVRAVLDAPAKVSQG